MTKLSRLLLLDPWLHDVHSKIWGRKDLQSEIFRQVKVTAAHYDALQKRLKEQHPDRDLPPNYDASRNNVLSIKLETLNQTNEQIHVQDDEDLEESDGNDDTEFSSFLPATLEFETQERAARLPLPLFLCEEYSLISRLLEERSNCSSGSAIVSGQPRTGEVLVFLVT